MKSFSTQDSKMLSELCLVQSDFDSSHNLIRALTRLNLDDDLCSENCSTLHPPWYQSSYSITSMHREKTKRIQICRAPKCILLFKRLASLLPGQHSGIRVLRK